ncbi:bifunctional adenosylcobinamide kinase/adenosylcobinamide-phosphate guanylyltransferase [Furfurilactobacillus siliginis]|uniref:Adenosylcobinamide kinase n=1 Tax=Furfurilactobacillus siliginis TaxID=348151 RepID=A0A0R2LC32_9LACO|nr:bifunctional adenosylcobinamide kinase/adenosylcobinamide-phosphate guanylyltransferase [Furfurilactobacillus siliginis]KRN96205.1 adenosylcobinamide-phosphate guanylyltransferase [Furfurilactobacillus siliginis]GEK27870.1 adenosylcobinamide kinase [Furfurilactobacillus siliginis]
MGKLTVVSGGAKSGKSVYAEEMFSREKRICYIATGVLFKQDVEMQRRIEHHQKRRPSSWVTRETYEQVADVIGENDYDGVLLDDATMLTTNLFFKFVTNNLPINGTSDVDEYIENMSKDAVEKVSNSIMNEWECILQSIDQSDSPVVIVTNEVGLGIVPATKQTRILRDCYGLVNQRLAKVAVDFYLVVSGLPLKIK